MAGSRDDPQISPPRCDVYDRTCPARLVLEHVTSRWGVLALGALQERTFRFSELRRRLDGVSEKMLAQTLRTLERDGFVLRRPYPEIPPRVEYSLTRPGQQVARLATALVTFVEDKTPEILRQQELDDARRHDARRHDARRHDAG